MGNLMTYLKWRGDLSFIERPFCEIDNLVLSALAYLDLSGIVPTTDSGDAISVTEATEIFCRSERGNKCVDGPPPDFLSCMAATVRYGQAMLSKHTEVIDEEAQTDFSALHIHLDDGSIYIAFRGTSDSLVGWREDFSMSFQLMPAQKLAAEYLSETIKTDDSCWYYVGGHSKGGNLAVYAAMMLPARQQSRILAVYSNDGPGLCDELIDMSAYEAIRPKIKRIVPQFSMIGALFELEPPTIIVESDAIGFYQHDIMSWQIEADRLVTCEKRSDQCTFYNQILDQWIRSADFGQRKAFTKDLFDSLEASGAKKLPDLAHSHFDEFEIILLSIIQSQSKTKLMVGKLIHAVLSAFQDVPLRNLVWDKKTVQGMALFGIGLFLMSVPSVAAQCLGTLMGIAALLWLGRKQLLCACAEEAKIRLKKPRLILQQLMMCVIAALIAQQSLLVQFSSKLLGCMFLIAAYRWAKTAFEKPMKKRIFYFLAATLSFLLGMVPLIIAGLAFEYYVLPAGSFILLYGTGMILQAMYANAKRTKMSQQQ